MFGDRELRAAFRGPGVVQITIGAESFNAYPDVENADVLTAGGEFSSQVVRRSVLAITSEIPPAVVVDADIVVDGIDAKVRQVMPLDEGAVSRIIYVKA